MATATLSTKGQIIIPIPIRRKLHLGPQDKIDIVVKGDEIVLHPLPRDPIEACFGALKTKKSAKSMVRAARREELHIEDKKWKR